LGSLFGALVAVGFIAYFLWKRKNIFQKKLDQVENELKIYEK
jgi:hypothetical protein